MVARVEDRKRRVCCKDANSNYSWGLQDSFCCNLRMQWSKEQEELANLCTETQPNICRKHPWPAPLSAPCSFGALVGEKLFLWCPCFSHAVRFCYSSDGPHRSLLSFPLAKNREVIQFLRGPFSICEKESWQLDGKIQRRMLSETSCQIKPAKWLGTQTKRKGSGKGT